MAKVYDALKQVEAERSRQLKQAEAPRVVSRQEATFWKRFSGRLAGRDDGDDLPDDAVAPDRLAGGRMESVLGRLDAFEHLASKKIPELERNLVQLLEERIDAVEREVATSISALGNQMRHDAATLNKRVTLLLGAVLLLLVGVLLRA